MSSTTKAGLVLAVLLGLSDVIFTFVPAGPGDDGPPLWIRVLGLLLGLITLVGVALVARSSSPRTGRIMIYVTRILSALSAVPGLLFAPGTGIKLAIALSLVLTIACLVLLARRQPAERGL